MRLTLSVIIPCLNDADRLRATLEKFRGFGYPMEIIVADASKGTLRDLAALYARQHRAIHVPLERAGRGHQLRAGAARATREILLFQHADVHFGKEHLASMLHALARDRSIVGGGFYKDLDKHYPMLGWTDRIIKFWERHVGIIYGDQSVFVRRSHYERLGGIRDMPLMEDMEFSYRLRAGGKVVLLEPALFASMRRFREEGVVHRKFFNWLTIQLYRMGATPDWLYRFYYGRRPGS